MSKQKNIDYGIDDLYGGLSNSQSTTTYEWDSAYLDIATKKGKVLGLPKVYTAYKPCYESHPVLKIGEFEVYGGSCSSPVVKDADVYVGFDQGMRCSTIPPWENPPVSFLYYITDMDVPKNLESFKKLLDYLHEQLKSGKKVHLGCIGGHGRTGLVLSALTNLITGDTDSTTYVRKHYCEKAVETDAQIKWLHEHFGIKPVEAVKVSSWGGYGGTVTSALGYGGKGTPKNVSILNPIDNAKESIWRIF